MSNPVTMTIDGNIAIVTVNNPPVNALSHAVRLGLQSCVSDAANSPEVHAIVLCAQGRTFIAGADIREFGKPPMEPILPDLVNEIEATAKPIVVALHGTVLGGGLEVALGCHYRMAAPGTKLGLPEVSLGIIPGAGGTQRLPRVVAMDKAISMITSGAPIKAEEAVDCGLIDRLSGEDLQADAIAYAQELIRLNAAPRPVSDVPATPLSESDFEAAKKKVTKAARGQLSPLAALDAIKASAEMPFQDGLAEERRLFKKMMESDQRKALIHTFFAERQVGKLPELEGVKPRAFEQIGVIGGGTMGAGIAVSALLAGLSVRLIERDAEAVARAEATVSKILMGSVRRGKLSQAGYETILANAFAADTDYGTLSEADIVIEAVFESMEVKKEVFTQLDAVCKPGAILASNTSYLDINDIAAITGRPDDVIGLHFFSPAHVMKLLEVVVAEKTSPEVVATGFALGKALRKISVRAGVCDGFIGNRILAHYRKAVDGAVLAGASPFDVDKALVGFGLAMGPFAVSDLAGLDIGWATRKRLAPTRDPRETYAEFADRLCENGHFGRKTGRGYYIYEDGGTRQNPDVDVYVAADRVAKGITSQTLTAQDIIDRYMAAMVNEAARVVDEGIALRPLDVDVTLMNGYGFPRWRGGPMQYADTVGIEKILNDIRKFAAEDGFLWQPAPLLERLVAEGKNFASLNS